MSQKYNAFVAGTGRTGFERRVETRETLPLEAGDVRIAVDYSSVNYKDHLASTESGKVARIDPIIPGIDLAGKVIESSVDSVARNQAVIAHGYKIGVARDGGFSEVADVPADWLVRLPETMTTEQAMILGTAGFTAGLSVEAILRAGVSIDSGPVLVTGATGGVGSIATALLSRLGYQVTASTGRGHRTSWLRKLGAHDVIDRLGNDAKPLEKEKYVAAVDSVGGSSLHAALASIRYGGIVTACGNTGGNSLKTTVFPFILRAVSLIGIDSVQCPLELRQETWNRLADLIDPEHYSLLRGQVVDLHGVDEALHQIDAGVTEGRTLVRP